MPIVYAILGDANTRKSSTTRALTGVYRRRVLTVATRRGNIDIFVQTSSLQEYEISPQAFMDNMNNAGHLQILVNLWISPAQNFPAGNSYLRDFVNAGWTIEQIVILGSNPIDAELPIGSPIPLHIPNSTVMPANQIACQVRENWNWL